MALKDFIKSRLFFKHLLLIIGSFLVLLVVLNLILKLYTRHGQEYEVPDITHKILFEVEKQDDMSKFEIVVLDSIYKEGVAYGTILTQDPYPSSMVKKGRKIYVTIAASGGEIVQMCNCKDLGLKSAVQTLIDKGLKVGTILFRTSAFKSSPIVVEQRYKGQTIKAGSDIQLGERIDLVVEVNSTTELIRIPDIIGKTEQDAEILLWKAGLNVGSKNYEGDRDEKHTRVASYSPVSKTAIIGTSISLNLYNDTSRKYQKEVENFKEESEKVEEETSTTEVYIEE
ncbi:MAG: hypothetical protein HUK18_06665 [Bacteroidales bacterium]|nr:hypothetical protein [Bacteroidales bacterium]